MNPPVQQDDIMQNIQEMIGNLLKNAIDKVQTTDINKQLGGATEAPAGDDMAGLMQTQLDITEIKKIVNTMHRFLDSISTMISQLESGNIHYSADSDKFLDDYINTADNIFEIAAFSMKDSLTGLSNKYGFDNRLILEWNRAARDRASLSLFLISIDGFNSYKKTYGAQKGDVLLQSVAKVLEQSIKRTTDFCARLDDVFAIILSTTDIDGAQIVADRVFLEVANTCVPIDEQTSEKLTVSIGASVLIPTHNEQAVDFVAKASNALKKASESGRSKVVID